MRGDRDDLAVTGAGAGARGTEPVTLGMAAVARRVFEGRDLQPLFDAMIARLDADPTDAAALMDLATILQSHGRTDEAAALRAEAVALSPTFATPHGDGSGPRLLALVTPGDFMSNTPVDFLLSGSDVTLLTHHVDETIESLTDLPPHDALLMGVAEAPAHRATLARLDAIRESYRGRMLNGNPARIAGLTRDGVSRLLADIPGVLCPATLRAERAALAAVAAGAPLEGLHPGLCWPLVLRPVGTHAGEGMERVLDHHHLGAILMVNEAHTFYLAPFVEYIGKQGLYAKARVVLIGGRPYPVHLALSDHWIVHYLSAAMSGNTDRRDAEREWFETFDDEGGFAHRHAAAFAAMQARVGLDYWGLDCAETADGRLLVFEIDTALIVHDMDDAETFPYKRPAVHRLFRAFRDLAFGA
ncbi:hypothetical protein GCM10008024_34920 [Allgaiera indica]|nr:hypothetical protein [Allgaiera indica]GHE05145.1 hypothetical protein GCM10008024_34920 [Allgaiera indica]